MNTQTKKALEMAIEALAMDNDCECGRSNEIVSALVNAIQACKEALAQPAQEPFAWYKPEGSWHDGFMLHKDRGISELSDATYTIPLYKGEDNA